MKVINTGIIRKSITGAIALLFASLVFGGAMAAAQTAGQGLEISPPLITANVDPGKPLDISIKLRNVTKAAVVTDSEINDFEPVGELGQSKISLDKNAEPSAFSFKSWVQPIARMQLAAGEVKTVKVTLNVPKNASAGAHYGVIRFSATPPELEGAGVALNASVGSLVLVNVSGNVVNKATMAQFFTAGKDGKAKSLFEYSPVRFVERIKNEGTTIFQPLGTIRVTNTFGKEVGVLTVNQAGGNVLPGSIRRFEQDFTKKRLFGRYTATANITYNGQNLSDTVTFWVIPYKVVAIVLGVLILVGVAVRTGMKRAINKAVNRATSAGSSKPKASPKKKTKK